MYMVRTLQMKVVTHSFESVLTVTHTQLIELIYPCMILIPNVLTTKLWRIMTRREKVVLC